MQRFRGDGKRGGTAVTSAAATPALTISASRRARWRLSALAVSTIAATGLATAFATAASAQPAPAPAAHVAPGAVATFNSHAGTTRYVFYTAADGSVWQKVAGGGAATAVGGRLVSAPSPVIAGDSIHVFGQGTDNALWETTCVPGGSCTGWHSLGGRLTSKPGAADTDDSTYAVYVRGADGAVWARNHTGAGWGSWHLVGGRVLSGTGPAAAHRESDYVLVTGTNRELYIARPGETGFSVAGGITTASPALTDTPEALVGFARGTDSAGWYHEFLSTTPGWHSLGGYLTSGMAAAGYPFGWYAYGLGGDSQVWENSGTPGSWTRVTP